jgi:hypothetical protein
MDGETMASSPANTLTALQRDVLRAFFARERGFFLTGGGALAGYHLGHRTTDDLDLFTDDPAAFERGRFVLDAVAAELGATVEVRQDAPLFRRLVLTRPGGGLVVDLVCDRGPQVAQKLERDGVRVDPPEEILVNKLTAVVGRAEERDLVDLLFLERAGFRIEDGLNAALAKDGGCTPANLAWVLSEIVIPDGTPLPGAISAAELRTFVTELVRRLRLAALPAAR